jgi:gliding motility-associated lipoprotein GldD
MHESAKARKHEGTNGNGLNWYFCAFALSCIFALLGCSENTPKPRGYFRIDLPGKTYGTFNAPGYPYTFEYADIAQVTPKAGNPSDPFWIDIIYPQFNARIYGSYKKVENNFQEIAEDSRTFVYKHTIKADAITEQPYENEERKVYGILYELKGNTASGIQFILTDSTRHFFRGALYFNASPNKDSIAPVAAFIREDIIRLIETLEWK